jgi:hypothetical protein
MARVLKLHDVVALLRDLPREGLRRGQVGTVVEVYKSGRYEVEFADGDGQTLAMLTLPKTSLLRLSYEGRGKRQRSRLVA